MQNDDIIDIEPIRTQVVVCPKCGQKNRISNELKVHFRCGACKHVLNPDTPFSRASSVASSLKLGRFKLSRNALGVILAVFGISIIVILATLGSKSPNNYNPPIPQAPYRQATPTYPRPAYVRPTTDPYGNPWPIVASYIKGSKRSHTRGYSKVTVDNKENDSDVHVKLIALSSSGDKCVREFYIPAQSLFTVSRVSPGLYEIRCLLLNSGSSSRTDSFQLEETRTADGINYSTLRLTLYKVPYGNMHTYSISPNEFYNVPNGEDEVPNLSLNSDPACIAFRPFSSSRFLGFAHRLGAGGAG